MVFSIQWASTNPRQSLEDLIRNQTLVAHQRLQRLTWICLHVLLNACLNHPQLAIYRADAQPAIVCMWASKQYVQSIDRTACRMCGQYTEQPKQRHLSIELRRFIDCKCTLMQTLCFHIDGHIIRYQYVTTCEDVVVSCDAYIELQMILELQNQLLWYVICISVTSVKYITLFGNTNTFVRNKLSTTFGLIG